MLVKAKPYEMFKSELDGFLFKDKEAIFISYYILNLNYRRFELLFNQYILARLAGVIPRRSLPTSFYVNVEIRGRLLGFNIILALLLRTVVVAKSR